ncbi:MAG: recombinase family protein [Chordicoccus sp.]
MSSLAQEESRSISQNVTWGQRRRFAAGRASVAFSSFLGYEKGEDGKWVVNEEQAEIVKLIYRMFLEGNTYSDIARTLESKGIQTPGGKAKWSISTVKSILSNEKYRGDALLQKQFTVDYLNKTVKKNEGEVPQFYVENHHPAIISPDTFDLVQIEIERRSKIGACKGKGIFSAKIKCAECGGWYGQKIWHSNEPCRKVVWRCNKKYSKRQGCPSCNSPVLSESEIRDAFVRAMNRYLGSKDEIIENMKVARKLLNDISGLEEQRDEYAAEMNTVSELLRKANDGEGEAARSPEKRTALETRYLDAKDAYEKCCLDIQHRQARSRRLQLFIKEIGQMDSLMEEFDPRAFGIFVDHMTVYTDKKIMVTFKDGTVITAE